jgi:hypothetical protein
MGTETDGVFSGPIPAVQDHFLRPLLASGPRDIAGRLLGWLLDPHGDRLKPYLLSCPQLWSLTQPISSG